MARNDVADATHPIRDRSKESQAAPTTSWWKLARRRFLRNRLSIAGLIVLSLLFLIAIAGPTLVAKDLALRPQPRDRLQEPSSEHLLGTDEVGRDVFARLIYAARVSLGISFFTMIVSIILGTFFGVVSGYYGGIVDQGLMRFTDAMLSLPSIFILLLIAAVIRPNITMIVLVLGFLNWIDLARILRGQVLSLKRLEFIEACRALGCSNGFIIRRHVIPNALGSILVAAPLIMGRALLSESALSFLGLGIQPPIPTWGNMLNNAQANLILYPELAVSPGIMIVISVVTINFIGDGLRDAFDPKQSR
jgi:peptide/nickel transport system permease protein